MKIFHYNTPIDLLERLNNQFRHLESDVADPDRVMDFCLTAWSMADWVYHHNYYDGSKLVKEKFREIHIFNQCEDLKTMHDIANGIKHFSLYDGRSKSHADGLRLTVENELPASLDCAFEEPQIRLDLDDGTTFPFFEVMQKVMDFWNGYLEPWRRKRS